jgi:leader peptidase (prepilin peptidase) / N-methyltransferase
LLGLVSLYDVRTRRAPNRIVYPALGLVAAGSLPLGLGAAIEALAGAGLSFAIFCVIAVAGRGAMGLGDVKVSALCGLVVGLHGVFWLIALTFLVALAVATPLVLFRVYGMRDTIAFTPFLAAGTALTLCLGHSYLWP